MGPVEALEKEWGKKVDDMCDAALMCYYGTEHLEALLAESAVLSTHTRQFGQRVLTPPPSLEWDGPASPRGLDAF